MNEIAKKYDQFEFFKIYENEYLSNGKAMTNCNGLDLKCNKHDKYFQMYIKNTIY